MPKTKVSLDVTNLNNFTYDMSKCIKCKGCNWVDHTYMPGVTFSTRCPSATRYQFDSYGAYGKMRIGLGIAENRLEQTDSYLNILYACTLCGACDVGCKRNLDLEIELTLESMRVKAVKDGKGPLPAHKKVVKDITTKHNSLGALHANRKKWLPAGIKPAAKADVLYFAGCMSSYSAKEIAQSTAKILNAAKTPFMLMPDEQCCGNIVYSVGMFDEAKKIAKANIDAFKKTGATTLLTACAECYRTWKVDYPKMLGISTADLGFRVVHLVEFADELIKKGKLKLKKPVDLRIAYHDSCSISRLSDPWVPWKGERGLWGVVNPPLERRRGSKGLYQQPREILTSIPGIKLVETPRKQENTFCCGAGRGVKQAFPDFALWAANEKLTEVEEVGAQAVVSTCPWCRTNFNQAIKANGNNLKAYDISELISASVA